MTLRGADRRRGAHQILGHFAPLFPEGRTYSPPLPLAAKVAVFLLRRKRRSARRIALSAESARQRRKPSLSVQLKRPCQYGDTFNSTAAGNLPLAAFRRDEPPWAMHIPAHILFVKRIKNYRPSGRERRKDWQFTIFQPKWSHAAQVVQPVPPQLT